MREKTTAKVRLDADEAVRFGRFGAVNHLLRPPLARAERDLPLPDTLKGAILVHRLPGIRGMSVLISEELRTVK
jgi:hypothetical protein